MKYADPTFLNKAANSDRKSKAKLCFLIPLAGLGSFFSNLYI